MEPLGPFQPWDGVLELSLLVRPAHPSPLAKRNVRFGNLTPLGTRDVLCVLIEVTSFSDERKKFSFQKSPPWELISREGCLSIKNGFLWPAHRAGQGVGMARKALWLGLTS